MAGDRRLRGILRGAGFGPTLDYRGIAPRTDVAKALAALIGQLRSAATLPLAGDLLVEFWGAEQCWARRFSSTLWLYYRADSTDDHVILVAVHDHVHTQ